MGGLSAIGAVGPGLRGVELAARLQAASLETQVDTTRQLGDLALQLIEGAALDSGVGGNLDIRI